jgi:hypothetical protein
MRASEALRRWREAVGLPRKVVVDRQRLQPFLPVTTIDKFVDVMALWLPRDRDHLVAENGYSPRSPNAALSTWNVPAI